MCDIQIYDPLGSGVGDGVGGRPGVSLCRLLHQPPTTVEIKLPRGKLLRPHAKARERKLT